MVMLGNYEMSTTLIVILMLIVLLYVYFTWNHNFWKNRGIPGPQPLPLFGTALPLFTKGMKDADQMAVKKYGKVVGLFFGSQPSLLITDPEILKQILVKEFPNFVNRVPKSFMFDEFPLNKFISLIHDEEWKNIRNAITPSFSGNKLRKMTARINGCADQLTDNLMQVAETGEPIEMKEYTGAFTMDVIANVGFGIQIDSQKNPDNPFAKHAKKAFDNEFKNPAFVLSVFLPKIYPVLRKIFDMSIFPRDVTVFFMSVIKQAIDHKKEDNENTDLLQLMLNAEKDDTKIEDIDEEISGLLRSGHANTANRKGLTHEEIIAQCLIILVAAYETTANTLAFLAYNLALNPDCQDKLHEEIETALEEKDKITYDMTHSVPYLDMCIHETLRMFPSSPRLQRISSKDITIRGLRIPAQTGISIPVYALQHDPDYWPEPEKFRPERFTEEAKAARNPYTYMPFGLGPRNCVGMRLAQLEMKVAVMKMIHKVRFTKCWKTEINPKMKKGGTLYAEKGLHLTVESRQ